MAKRRNPSPVPLGGTPKDRKAPTRVRPFPEIIDEAHWEVREGRYPSYIKRDTGERPKIMQVPLGDTAIDRKIRLHEEAHAAWTPDIPENDPRLEWLREIDTLNATEDARIIELMNRTKEDWRQLNEEQMGLFTPQMQQGFQDGFGKLAAHLRGDKEREDAAKIAAARKAGKPDPKITPPDVPMSLLQAARLIASTRGYAEGQLFDQIASGVDLDWVRKDVEKMHQQFISSREDPTFDDSIAYAERMEEYFENKQREIEEQNQATAEMMAGTDMYDSPGTGEKIEEVFTPDMKEKRGSESKTVRIKGGTVPEYKKGGKKWGALTITHKTLVEKLAARHARRPRPTDMGAVPRYMHRLMCDQRVFGRRRKKKAFQGTVLIDCSGSMQLTEGQVDEMLRRWPAVTVATYNGEGTKGDLWIVAAKGKRARKGELHPPHGGNVVDGPCLDWLSKQKMPRVWISDGGVTGASDSGGGESAGYAFIADAAKKMKRGKIKRLANVHELLGQDGDEDYVDYVR